MLNLIKYYKYRMLALDDNQYDLSDSSVLLAGCNNLTKTMIGLTMSNLSDLSRM